MFAVLLGYFDDSGTHATSELVAVAGLVGPEEEWATVEREWAAILQEANLDDFHAADFFAGHWGYLTGYQPEAVAGLLASIVAKSTLTIISASVRTQDWKQCVAEPSALADFRSRYRNPFTFCFEHCLQLISSWVSDYQHGENIALVFNEQLPEEARAHEIFNHYKASKRFGGPLKSLTFSARRDLPILGTCDLVAHSLFREWIDISKERSEGIRRVMRIIADKQDMRFATHFPKGQIEKAVAQYADKEKL